jgi:gluconolactonase
MRRAPLLAYHIVFGAYGFWLSNDPRGSWSTRVGSPSLLRFGEATKTSVRRSVAHRRHDHEQRLAAKRALKHDPVQLSGVQARAVGGGIAAAAEESEYVVHACAILPDHVHLVVARHDRDVRRIATQFKARATQRLKHEQLWPAAERPVWAGVAGSCFSSLARPSCGRYATWRKTRSARRNLSSDGLLCDRLNSNGIALSRGASPAAKWRQTDPLTEHSLSMKNYQALPQPAAAVHLKTVVCLAFTEGPAVDADENVYFSDIINNRIMKLAADGTLSVFREPSHRTNGQTFDHQGRLYHCEGAEFGPGGGRRVTRTDLATGEYVVVTDRYAGVRYNSPNDICVDGQGRVYFTDPCYWDRTTMEMREEGVYRIDLDGQVTRILEQPQIDRPNGVAVTQDSRHLYVIDSCPTERGSRKVWAFDLDAAGNPHAQRLVYDFAPGRGGDGMRLDTAGNLYVAAGVMAARGPYETDDVPPGIYIISPAGELLGCIPIYEDVLTNLAFGGADGRTIYITAGKTLIKTRVDVPGQVAYPRWNAAAK